MLSLTGAVATSGEPAPCEVRRRSECPECRDIKVKHKPLERAPSAVRKGASGVRWNASAGAGVHAAVLNAATAPANATAAPLLLSMQSSIAVAPCVMRASSCRDSHGCNPARL